MDSLKELDSLIKLRRKITNNIKVSYALTDISAMEVQFHSRKIPCGVIVNGNCKENIFIPKSYYLIINIIYFTLVMTY